MLNKLIELFSKESQQTESSVEREKLIQLSIATLLIEISLADTQIGDAELQTMLSIVKKEFGYSDNEANELLAEAEKKAKDSVSLYEFTNQLKDALSLKERYNVIKQLWKVAYADDVLDKYEEYYVRKIADLLYVPQVDYIKAKLAAQESLAS